jgi:23S rRNA (guanosine2251-2'-O)-methyltransferase
MKKNGPAGKQNYKQKNGPGFGDNRKKSGDNPRFKKANEPRTGEPAKKRYEDKAGNFGKKHSKDAPVEVYSEERHEDEKVILKGRHEVLQALKSEQSIETVFVNTTMKGPLLIELREMAKNRNIPFKELTGEVFKKKFGVDSQGVVAIAGAFDYCTLDELIESANKGAGILIALNCVEDARNLGAIVRTVEASGCDGIIIPKLRSAGMTEWAIRTAQGAASILPVARVTNLGDSIEKAKKAGFWAVGLDGSADKDYTSLRYSDKVILVAGGEDTGIGPRIKKVCDDVVAIPLKGKTSSLNVSVSTAVVLYEILRQKDFFKKV